MEAIKALIVTIIVHNLVINSFFFILRSYLQDSRQYKQFLVLFIDSSSRTEEKLTEQNLFTEPTGKKSLFS